MRRSHNSLLILFLVLSVALNIGLFAQLVKISRAKQPPELSLRIRSREHEAPTLIVEGGRIGPYLPTNPWQLELVNTSATTATYPTVRITFEYIGFEQNQMTGWTAVGWADQLGWNGFQWSPGPNQIVPPKSSIFLPPMDLSGGVLGDGLVTPGSLSKVDLEVTISATDYPTKVHRLPVRLINF